jgi:hypothetical protein
VAVEIQEITEAGHPETRVKAGKVTAKATVAAVEMEPGHRDRRISNVEIEQGYRGLVAHSMNDVLRQPLSLRMRLALLQLADQNGQHAEGRVTRPKRRLSDRVEFLTIGRRSNPGCLPADEVK